MPHASSLLRAQVYSAGVARFLSELRAASRSTGKALYCPERIREKLAGANLGTSATQDMVATSLLDRSARMPSGSGTDHYTSLSRWLEPSVEPYRTKNAIYLFDLSHRVDLFPSLVNPSWGCILWSDPEGDECDNDIIRSGVRTLNDPALGIRVFVWSAVEIRLFAQAHKATLGVLGDEADDGNSTTAVFPSHWFDSSEYEYELTEEANDRLTMITFESISHHAKRHCYVLRQDGREVRPSTHTLRGYPTPRHCVP